MTQRYKYLFQTADLKNLICEVENLTFQPRKLLGTHTFFVHLKKNAHVT